MRKNTIVKHLIVWATVATLLMVGSYFIVHSNRAAAEKARIIKEEQDSKKIEKKTFGYSTAGKPIEGYEIGNGPKTILLLASVHGDEIGTVDLLNRFVEEIKVDPNIISKTKRLIIIPIANPDGYYDRTDKLNANGINLNLNFATSDWEEYGSGGTYAGPEPFSEVESRIIKQVVEEYKPEMMISYHAMGGLVLPELDDASIALAHWYANKTGYEYYDIWNFFGTSTRWFSETVGKPAITVELTAYRPSDWEINRPALMDLVSSD